MHFLYNLFSTFYVKIAQKLTKVASYAGIQLIGENCNLFHFLYTKSNKSCNIQLIWQKCTFCAIFFLSVKKELLLDVFQIFLKSVFFLLLPSKFTLMSNFSVNFFYFLLFYRTKVFELFFLFIYWQNYVFVMVLGFFYVCYKNMWHILLLSSEETLFLNVLCCCFFFWFTFVHVGNNIIMFVYVILTDSRFLVLFFCIFCFFCCYYQVLNLYFWSEISSFLPENRRKETHC